MVVARRTGHSQRRGPRRERIAVTYAELGKGIHFAFEVKGADDEGGERNVSGGAGALASGCGVSNA